MADEAEAADIAHGAAEEAEPGQGGAGAEGEEEEHAGGGDEEPRDSIAEESFDATAALLQASEESSWMRSGNGDDSNASSGDPSSGAASSDLSRASGDGSVSTPSLSFRLPSEDSGDAALAALATAGHPGAFAPLGGPFDGIGGTGTEGLVAALLAQADGINFRRPLDAVASRLASVQEELAHSERRRRAAENDLETERSRHEAQMRESEQRWQQHAASLRRSVELAEGERDVACQRLDDRRHLLADGLDISDALAAELRRRPPEELSVREAVRLSAHGLLHGVREELERVRRELEVTRQQLRDTSDAAEARAGEHARAKRLADGREEGLKLEVAALNTRVSDLTLLGEHAEAESATLRDKGRRYDELAAAFAASESALEAARALASRQADALASAAEAERMLSQRAVDAEQRRATLEADKSYLTRELDAVQAAADRAERSVAALSERCRELERARDALAEELPRAATEARESFEKRLAAEVARLWDANAKELDDVRGANREVWERENATLREARQSAVEESGRLRGELSSLRATYDDLVLRMGRSEASREAELAEARGELRLRSFEVGQLGVAFEEKCGAMRQAELREEMLQQQLDAHKTEFARLEVASEQKMRELQLLLDTEREKVRAIEELELELDHAVMRAGESLLPAARPSTSAAADGATEALPIGADDDAGATEAALDVLDNVPTAPKRRVRQAIWLAHRLLQKEGEADRWKKTARAAAAAAAAAEKRRTEAEAALAATGLPARYMVQQMQEKEAEVAKLRAAYNALEEHAAGLKETCRRTEGEKEDLQLELKRVVNARTDVETLRALLNEMQASERGRDGALGATAGIASMAAIGSAQAQEQGTYGTGLQPQESGGYGTAVNWGAEEGLSTLLTHHVGQGARAIPAGAPRWYRAG